MAQLDTHQSGVTVRPPQGTWIEVDINVQAVRA
ncbi:MAG: hypothetical protein JWM18_1362 [Chloroflexi bacterium]|nr:hypothetical protein [Chloroflexota bacterium]